MLKTKILIIAGGGVKHLEPFRNEAKGLNISLELASFNDLEYLSENQNITLKVNNRPLEEFGIVYIRLVGKRSEECALLVNNCKSKNIKIVDEAYTKNVSIRIPYPKAIEAKLLIDSGVSVPKTYFASLDKIFVNAPKIFGYPFVIKGTTGKQGHAVWSPLNEKHIDEIKTKVEDAKLKDRDMRFIAQEFIKASQRVRVFVVGGKALAAITRPTRWRKRFIRKVNGEFPAGKREALIPVPDADAQIALKAAKSLFIDIAGVDVISDDKSGKKYVLEVNSAPRWESIKADTGINVEREILKYLNSIN